MSRSMGDYDLHLERKADFRVYKKSDFYVIFIGSDGLYDHLD